jgi:hypothetical protein
MKASLIGLAFFALIKIGVGPPGHADARQEFPPARRTILSFRVNPLHVVLRGNVAYVTQCPGSGGDIFEHGCF